MVVKGANDRFLLVKPGSSYFQGDVNAPRTFVEGYNRVLDRWSRRVMEFEHAEACLPLSIEDFHQDILCPAAVTGMADDLARAGVCYSASDLVRQLRFWQSSLRSSISSIGLAENHHKHKILIASKQVRDLVRSLPGLVHETTYLGSVLTENGSCKPDTRNRCDLANKAWFSLGKLWLSPLGIREKASYYKSLVLSALLSGLEAVLIDDTDEKALEVQQCKYLRKLMCGEACRKVIQTDQQGISPTRIFALSNRQVREFTRVQTIASTLASRRLKWLQQLVKHSNLCAGTLALIYGCFLWEGKKQVGLGGRLTTASNPWLRQFYVDLKLLAMYDESFLQVFETCRRWSIFEPALLKAKVLRVRSCSEPPQRIRLNSEDFAQECDSVGSFLVIQCN